MQKFSFHSITLCNFRQHGWKRKITIKWHVFPQPTCKWVEKSFHTDTSSGILSHTPRIGPESYEVMNFHSQRSAWNAFLGMKFKLLTQFFTEILKPIDLRSVYKWVNSSSIHSSESYFMSFNFLIIFIDLKLGLLGNITYANQ